MKIAIVGMGHFGPLRVRALRRVSPSLELVACDHHPHKLQAVLDAEPGVRGEASFDAILSDPEIDAVVLSTPIATHVSLGLAALEAGKHLFVEKPMATSVREAEQMLELATRRERVLVVGHSFEQSPPGLSMLRMVGDGVLGRLRYASIRRVGVGRDQPGSSVLWDLAVHDVSLLLRLLDEMPSQIQLTGAAVASEGQLDVGFLALEFPSGFVANLECSWRAPNKARLILLVGDEGALEYRAFEAQESLTHYRSGEACDVPLGAHAALDREMRQFLDACEQPSRAFGEGRHAVRVTRVLAAAESSYARRP